MKQNEAENIFEEALSLDEEGKTDEALEKYLLAASMNYDNPNCYYNIGLIYKYRNKWEESFHYNEIAYQMDPESEAARWNYAIAGTALRNWPAVRKAWSDNGFNLEGDIGPIDMDFGNTPVRLNPDRDAEVVWAKRIDPVRAKIISVPTHESGFHYSDIVLHDGASTGARMVDDIEYPVFNMLELFEASKFLTFVVEVEIKDHPTCEKLLELLDENNIVCEDWTENFRMLCKACSEGIPHEHNDSGENETVKIWNPIHDIAIATLDVDESVASITNAVMNVGAKINEIYRAE